MSNRILNDAWGAQCATPTQKLVLVRLADRANDQKGGTCFPSIATIARDCGVDKRTVQRAISDLVKAGHVSVSQAGGGGPRATNRYKVHPRRIATPGMMAPDPRHIATPPPAIDPDTPGILPPKPKATQTKPKENRRSCSSFFDL
ncbi:MAG: helix-turn-helix domain-containing protein [Verrucomicrobiia bacterium]